MMKKDQEKDRVLIIQADYYRHISELLLLGASAELKKANIDFELVSVLGALEIPAAIAIANETKRFSGFIALGCVIRGETYHFDVVCNESARGINQIAIAHKLAIGNGILTVENEEQALNRADPKCLDKGGFAAKSCLTMIELKRQFLL